MMPGVKDGPAVGQTSLSVSGEGTPSPDGVIPDARTIPEPSAQLMGDPSAYLSMTSGDASTAREIATVTPPTTMRAAVIAAPGVVEVREVPLPEPKPDELRVRLEGCGVCASNVPTWEGRPWFTYPLPPGRPGHEAWGVVDAVGEQITRFRVGDRVAILSNGAYAEYDLATEEKTVLLPPGLDDQPFPAEPLGCAMNIFRRSDIRAGQTVAIIGIGFLGALLTRLASNAGARVVAISRRPFSLDYARQMGALETIELDDHCRVINRVAELTNGSGGYDVRGFCDRVIECTGKQWPLDLAAELCAVRAKLVIAGYHQDGPRQVNMQLWNWRGLDVINAHERDPQVYRQGMQAAVDEVSAARLDPMPLYTHTFPLEQLAEALNLTRDRPDGFIKALVREGTVGRFNREGREEREGGY